MRRQIATVQGRRATRISASARRQRGAMSVLERFLQRNQITKARPLPLVHTTEFILPEKNSRHWSDQSTALQRVHRGEAFVFFCG